MVNKLGLLLALLVVLFNSFTGLAQEPDSKATEEEYTEALGLVNFYQYLLNTIGDAKTTARNKEVIITQSYKKAFRDANVQIEDDLDEERKVVTNKDVTAYLKDVDFFFKQVTFEFKDIKIEKLERDNGQAYFKAAFTNVITGQDIEGKEIKRVSDRFVEINYREEENDLKIVSVYTTKLDRSKELKLWWESMSLAWKDIFMSKVPFKDSISLAYLEKVASIDSVDLSGNMFITNLEPLAPVRGLKSIDLSNTSVTSFEGIRNLIGITKINARGSKVEELEYLRYMSALTDLNLAETPVKRIDVLSNMKELKHLDLSQTALLDYSVLKDCPSLQSLALDKCKVYDYGFLSSLKQLQHLTMAGSDILQWPKIQLPNLVELDVSNTLINSTAQMSELTALEEINLNSTYITEISPLLAIPGLKKVYCDDTPITEAQASKWMKSKKGGIVLTNSTALKSWWAALSEPWKSTLIEQVRIAKSPTLDELVKLVNVDSLDISGKQLLDGQPLARLKRMRYLDVSDNLFTSIQFVEDMTDLQVFIGNKLPVDNIEPVAGLANLTHFELSNTILSDISALSASPKLKFVKVEGNPVLEDDVISLLDQNPDLIIQYKSTLLKTWWTELSDEWQQVFLKTIGESGTPSDKSLHHIIELNELKVEGYNISDLYPLTGLINLKGLSLINVPISDIKEISTLEHLERLEISKSPVEELEPLIALKNLTSLNISNTPVSTLKPLAELRNLENLDCSGTNIKNLKGLSELYQLQSLNLSNTRVWRLDRLSEISGITKIVCYNTRLRSHKIEEFKMLNPNCQVTFY